MKRLLAKLPRSSSGSREASASSSASRCPFDIFEVSMTEEAAAFSRVALVSAATCFSGASSGLFILSQGSAGILPASAGILPASTASKMFRQDTETGGLEARAPQHKSRRCCIKPGSVARVLLQNLARLKFIITLRDSIHFLDHLLQPEILRESQRSTPRGRETCPENHPIIGVLW